MTQRVQEALNAAYTRALTEHNTQTTPEHLLAAMLDQPEGVVAPILQKAGLDPTTIGNKVDAAIAALPRHSGPNADQGQVTVSPALARLLAAADTEAKALQRRLRLGRASAARDGRRHRRRRAALPRCRLDARETARRAARSARQPARHLAESRRHLPVARALRPRPHARRRERGKLDPVIGRDEEIRRVVQVLSRRTKNNPVLIGEPGVGKTAIVEGLGAAHRARRRARRAEEQDASSRSIWAR